MHVYDVQLPDTDSRSLACMINAENVNDERLFGIMRIAFLFEVKNSNILNYKIV